jgi:hypothetical protein
VQKTRERAYIWKRISRNRMWRDSQYKPCETQHKNKVWCSHPVIPLYIWLLRACGVNKINFQISWRISRSTHTSSQPQVHPLFIQCHDTTASFKKQPQNRRTVCSLRFKSKPCNGTSHQSQRNCQQNAVVSAHVRVCVCACPWNSGTYDENIFFTVPKIFNCVLSLSLPRS